MSEVDVYVVKHLNVIAKETDWRNHHPGVSLFFQVKNDPLDRGPKPGSAGHALALKGKVPKLRGEPGHFLTHQRGRLLCLLFIGVARLYGAHGHAVRGKYDRRRRTKVIAGLPPDWFQFFRERLDQHGMVMPLLNKLRGDFRLDLSKQSALVKAHAGGGVLRSKTDGQH